MPWPLQLDYLQPILVELYLLSSTLDFFPVLNGNQQNRPNGQG